MSIFVSFCCALLCFVELIEAFGFFGFRQSEGSCRVCSAKAWGACCAHEMRKATLKLNGWNNYSNLIIKCLICYNVHCRSLYNSIIYKYVYKFSIVFNSFHILKHHDTSFYNTMIISSLILLPQICTIDINQLALKAAPLWAYDVDTFGQRNHHKSTKQWACRCCFEMLWIRLVHFWPKSFKM